MAMPIPVNPQSIAQIGRAQAPSGNQEGIGYFFPLDFTASQTYIFDLATKDQQGVFGTPQGLYVSNFANPSPIIVTSLATQQSFQIPANATGYFKLDALGNAAKISFQSAGGAPTGQGNFTGIGVYNYDLNPNIWYDFGPFDVTKPLSVYGTLADGGAIGTDPNPQPLKIAGIDRATSDIHIISVDASGRINIDDTTPISVDITGAGALITESADTANRWQYSAAAGGYLNSVAVIPMKGAAGAGLRDYITSVQIYAEALGAATELVFLDGSANVLWRIKIPMAGMAATDFDFSAAPLKGAINQNVDFAGLTASITGAIYVNAQGYEAA